ncbi:GNAT family N-acetyltransferase [Deinococcus sp. KNUC1210]|uniref:GNAT family N-acetyltransferase n=1 Tax=Deinococcus sp. KNUC1210 TaxID=2917691 RepID=UPI001EEFE87D|nr:GNAT family N-acetyltransferase [Deinococcus sp. KNUC1210]ULH16716.1 GNAT family N-acetyltransferase [Deinococcus sp. KNUC1210]
MTLQDDSLDVQTGRDGRGGSRADLRDQAAPPPRSLGYRTDTALLVQAGSAAEQKDGYQVIRTPKNPTFWWGNFLLLNEVPQPEALPGWLHTFGWEFPEARHVALGLDLPGEVSLDIPPGVGLTLTRSAVMTLERPECVPPPHPNTQAEYRPLHSDADWQQALTLRLVTNDTLEPVAYQRFARRRLTLLREQAEAGLGAWFGAFLNGQMVAGMGLYTAGDGLARFQTVETHPAFRRRGLCGSLVAYAAAWGFEQLNARTLVMVADPEDEAIRVYRSLGFREREWQWGLERAPVGEVLSSERP